VAPPPARRRSRGRRVRRGGGEGEGGSPHDYRCAAAPRGCSRPLLLRRPSRACSRSTGSGRELRRQRRRVTLRRGSSRSGSYPGPPEPGEDDPLPDTEPVLASCYAAAAGGLAVSGATRASDSSCQPDRRPPPSVAVRWSPFPSSVAFTMTTEGRRDAGRQPRRNADGRSRPHRDLHPQGRAHAGRTKNEGRPRGAGLRSPCAAESGPGRGRDQNSPWE